MVRIRLQRTGRKNRPFYRIQVLDERTRRDGAGIEQLGWYDPVSRDESKQLNLNEERAKYWLSKGAQPSDTMRDIFAKRKLIDTTAWEAKRAKDRERVQAKATAATAAAAAAAAPKAEAAAPEKKAE